MLSRVVVLVLVLLVLLVVLVVRLVLVVVRVLLLYHHPYMQRPFLHYHHFLRPFRLLLVRPCMHLQVLVLGLGVVLVLGWCMRLMEMCLPDMRWERQRRWASNTDPLQTFAK
jgi:hypothetical protein